MVSLKPLLLLALSLSTNITFAQQSRPHIHFKTWYAQFGPAFQKALDENCANEYAYYLSDAVNTSSLYPYTCDNCHEDVVVDCILDATPESYRANMQSAAVLLGLLPTILSLAGSSTVEMGLVARARPILAVLLALGSPAASPVRAFEHPDPAELLARRSHSFAVPRFRRWMRLNWLICAVQYIFVAAAVVNVGVVSWQLSVRTICSFAMESAYLPGVWAALGLAVYACGALAVWLKVDLRSLGNGKNGSWNPLRWLRRELTLGFQQPEIDLITKQENLLSVVVAWAASTGTILHIILGTLVFSSVLFISTQDATLVVAQYLASTLVCRAVLIYELRGLSETVLVRKPSSSHINVQDTKG